MSEPNRKMRVRATPEPETIVFGVSSQYDPGLYELKDPNNRDVGWIAVNGSVETWAVFTPQNQFPPTAAPFVAGSQQNPLSLHSLWGPGIPPAQLDPLIPYAFDEIAVTITANAPLQPGAGGAQPQVPILFDQAVYSIKQNVSNAKVGDLIVESVSPTQRVQHWFLYLNQQQGTAPYVWPGANSDITNRFTYVRSYTQQYLAGTPARLAQRQIQYVYLRGDESYVGSFPASP